MSDRRGVESARFPYVPIRLVGNEVALDLEALLDTGFDGAVAVPPDLDTFNQEPDGEPEFVLADGSVIRVPAYNGVLHVGELAVYPVAVVVLGAEPIFGRRAIEPYTVILDHGRRLLIEP